MNRLSSDPLYTHAFVERGVRMVQRDRNHCSIIIWSLGNESGFGLNHMAMRAAIRQLDQTRPIMYEGGGAATPATDIICPMYGRTYMDQCLESPVPKYRLDKAVAMPGETRPLILCEYAHAMGNSLGGFDRYWEAFRNNPKLQGGFVWDWVDQGLDKTTQDGRHFWAYGGDFGDVINDRQFCINGLVFPDRSPHPALFEAKRCMQPFQIYMKPTAGRPKKMIDIEVKSEYLFRRTTDQEELRWAVKENGVSIMNGAARLDLGPEESCIVATISLPNFKAGSVATLDVSVEWCGERLAWCDKGHEIARQQFALPTGLGVKAVASGGGGVTLEDKEEALCVEAGGSKWTIDKKSGRISSWLVASLSPQGGGGLKNMLLSEICDNFYRAPLDNDIATSEADNVDVNSWLCKWNVAGLRAPGAEGSDGGLKHRVVGILVDSKNNVVEVEHEYVGEDGTLKICTKWRHSFFSDGAVAINVRVVVSDDMPSLPRIGAHLHFGGGIGGGSKVEWLGRGPHENYPDRCSGADIGLWKMDSVMDLHVPYIYPTDCGLRTDVETLTLGGSGGSPAAVRLEKLPDQSSFCFSAGVYGLAALAAAKHQTDLCENDGGGVFVCIDGKHMGIGGDDSWSQSVRPEFWVGGNGKKLHFEWGWRMGEGAL